MALIWFEFQFSTKYTLNPRLKTEQLWTYSMIKKANTWINSKLPIEKGPIPRPGRRSSTMAPMAVPSQRRRGLCNILVLANGFWLGDGDEEDWLRYFRDRNAQVLNAQIRHTNASPWMLCLDAHETSTLLSDGHPTKLGPVSVFGFSFFYFCICAIFVVFLLFFFLV